jgi:hypothetical protein
MLPKSPNLQAIRPNNIARSFTLGRSHLLAIAARSLYSGLPRHCFMHFSLVVRLACLLYISTCMALGAQLTQLIDHVAEVLHESLIS